jgi:hypothetical protein
MQTPNMPSDSYMFARGSEQAAPLAETMLADRFTPPKKNGEPADV